MMSEIAATSGADQGSRCAFLPAHQAELAPRLIPIQLAVWHALARASEMFTSPLLTRNQVELMQIDTVAKKESRVSARQFSYLEESA
jgi:hypothetical protein